VNVVMQLARQSNGVKLKEARSELSCELWLGPREKWSCRNWRVELVCISAGKKGSR